MTVICDGCGKSLEDALCQLVEDGREILYVCPDCFLQRQEPAADEQP